MPVEYDAETKGARLAAVGDRLNGGTLEIGTEGFAAVLARFQLGTPCAEVHDGELVFVGMPKRGMATNGGAALEARFRDTAGKIRAQGLTVGDEKSDAEVIVYPDADIKQGQTVELMGVRIIHG